MKETILIEKLIDFGARIVKITALFGKPGTKPEGSC